MSEISRQVKEKMISFTQLINRGNKQRYEYISCLERTYGQMLQEGSKTPHLCEICNKVIFGKAFGPHKKQHYKKNNATNKTKKITKQNSENLQNSP